MNLRRRSGADDDSRLLVQKFSRKGWICKTWEGELALVTMPGTAQEKFLFTVWDDDVATKINAAMGKRVSLHYEEKVGLPGGCFGDTRYWVNGVKSGGGHSARAGRSRADATTGRARCEVIEVATANALKDKRLAVRLRHRTLLHWRSGR